MVNGANAGGTEIRFRTKKGLLSNGTKNHLARQSIKKINKTIQEQGEDWRDTGELIWKTKAIIDSFLITLSPTVHFAQHQRLDGVELPIGCQVKFFNVILVNLEENKITTHLFLEV